MVFSKIEDLMVLKEPTDKAKMFSTLLKVQALSYFEHNLKKRLSVDARSSWK
jgi:hypothetical protein